MTFLRFAALSLNWGILPSSAFAKIMAAWLPFHSAQVVQLQWFWHVSAPVGSFEHNILFMCAARVRVVGVHICHLFRHWVLRQFISCLWQVLVAVLVVEFAPHKYLHARKALEFADEVVCYLSEGSEFVCVVGVCETINYVVSLFETKHDWKHVSVARAESRLRWVPRYYHILSNFESANEVNKRMLAG